MKFIAFDCGPRLARAFLTLAVFCTAGHGKTATLDFDKTFNAKGEARQIHYQAIYTLDGKTHRVEVWRDRDRRLKRRTDDILESFIFRPERQAEWHMVMLDVKRKIRTDIDRTNLYRIGHFTDWFGLSHALTRPTMPYRLTSIGAPRLADTPIANCRWYALIRHQVESRICWSQTLRLPLLVTDRHNQVQWRVTMAKVQPIPASVFQIEDRGFVQNNANEDIQAD